MTKVKKTCQNCDCSYFVEKKKFKSRKFCGLKCAYAFRTSDRVARKCEWCGKAFHCLPTSGQRFCCQSCSSKHYTETYTHSDETRDKISAAKIGHVPWNKGLTAKEDQRILSGEYSPAFGNPTCTKNKNPQWAENIKIATKGKINLGDKNAMKRPEVREKMSLTRKKVLQDPAKRKQLSETVRKAWADGKFDNVRVGQCKWYSHQKPDGSIVKVQGTWERAFAEWADGHGLIYTCHRGRLAYKDELGKQRSYYPDFYVNDWGCWVDVKNDYHIALQKDKFEAIRKCNPDQEVRIIDKRQMMTLGIRI